LSGYKSDGSVNLTTLAYSLPLPFHAAGDMTHDQVDAVGGFSDTCPPTARRRTIRLRKKKTRS